MQSANDICILDYLVGTLSTAYKGVITSLAAKDFCMAEEGDSIILRGRILSMPPGDYEASLIQKGIELGRTALEQGYFELKTAAARVRRARDLQIDIIQTGRHIGTFLLKKELSDGIYISAVELSDELKGMDFKLLTVPLRNKAGLLQKAEEIITNILSTKKDWFDFSEKLNSFTEDFFWTDRRAFYKAFRILAHFSSKAAERTDVTVSRKPLLNFLGCIELPMDLDGDRDRIRPAISVWLNELKESSVDFSAEIHRFSNVLRLIHAVFPQAEIAPSLAGLIAAVRKKLFALPALSPGLLDSVGNHITREALSQLERYGAKARRGLMDKLAEAEADLENGAFGNVFAFLKGLEPDLVDDGRMTKAFFDAVLARVTHDSADALSAGLNQFLSLFPVLSPSALDILKSNIPVFLQKLVLANRSDLCESLLAAIAFAGSPVKEEIMMNSLIAETILSSGNEPLIARYADALTRILIPAATVREISTETWAEIVNPLHLERLAGFMDILQLGNDRFQQVLIHVIANLAISGVFIPDDRLFQRKVSGYLNSGAMKGNFLLNYLLLEKLPVYYHEVGAVSRIRDYSTEIDSWGNDPVLYFVRKQVHVNASNYNIRLVEKIMDAWVFNDPGRLQNAIPPDVYANLRQDLFERYAGAIRPFFESLGVLDKDGLHRERLLNIPEQELTVPIRDGKPDEFPAKVVLLCRLYQEIVKKYSFLGHDHETGNRAVGLFQSVDQMQKLIQTIRKPEKTTAQEALYFKRHIAFGIPSVLGTYHEPKFDALGDFLRYGARTRPGLEEATAEIQSKGPYFTQAEAESWLKVLMKSYEIVELHGLPNFQIEEIIGMFETNRLHLSQVADLLKIWQKELAWMVQFFNAAFHKPIVEILKNFPADDLPEHLMNLDPLKPDFIDKAADMIIRNMLASVPALMETDILIERLLNNVTASIERDGNGKLGESRIEEGRHFFDFQDLHDREAAGYAPLLGGKAKNLVYLHNRGFSIPAGIVLSAALTDRFRQAGPGEMNALLIGAVQSIEERTGRRFGGSEKPLFLSVRSGSYVSMPGILSTILYCGMNRETIQAFLNETGDERLVLDSYRRFIEHYSTTVLGIDIPVFETIRSGFLNAIGLPEVESLHAGHLESLAQRYQREIARRGHAIPEDVYEQLRQSVQAIYASWSGDRAKQFRKATKTSSSWGTAVMLMQMVYGNAEGSGASVFFTRNPFTGEPGVYGETRERATGDELVYGRRLNRPLSSRQAAERDGADGKERERLRTSLEETDHELFSLHRELAEKIEQAMDGLPQEAEVTYVRHRDGKRVIFVLQTRRMEFSYHAAAKFDEVCAMENRIIGRGIGAHGGAVSGVASFARHPEQAVSLSRQKGMPVILLRKTANTEDVSLMPAIAGIVTASGGVTSHAAVLAQKFDINAVVACSGLLLSRNEQGEPYARINGTIIQEGSPISIDGSMGLVFSGSCFNILK